LPRFAEKGLEVRVLVAPRSGKLRPENRIGNPFVAMCWLRTQKWNCPALLELPWLPSAATSDRWRASVARCRAGARANREARAIDAGDIVVIGVRRS
jgi:hypothetical protein